MSAGAVRAKDDRQAWCWVFRRALPTYPANQCYVAGYEDPMCLMVSFITVSKRLILTGRLAR